MTEIVNRVVGRIPEIAHTALLAPTPMASIFGIGD
jgi:hypothetical protein